MNDKITVNMTNLTEEERKRLVELVEKANKLKSKVWEPKKGEQYYSINSSGLIIDVMYDDDGYDADTYFIGNRFKTREEAAFEVEKRKVYTELQRYAMERNEGEIDWNNCNQYKYVINYMCDCKKIEVKCFGCIKDIGQVYFTSKQIAEDAIKTVGEDRIKKYLFGVEV